MEMVAAAKMRKSQQSALSARPYSQTLHQVLFQVQNQPNISHLLLEENESNKELIILITSDRGLAGGLNMNLFREILRSESKNAAFITVGKKALQFAAKTNSAILASFGSEEASTLDLARRLAKVATESFITKEVSKISILYPHFASTVLQIPKWITLLPIQPLVEDEAQNNHLTNLLFEPSVLEIINVILPHHILTTIYQVLLESKASEHSARMVAMKNATDAASDLIDDLTLTYNQARQEAITKELLDIVTAQKAFE